MIFYQNKISVNDKKHTKGIDVAPLLKKENKYPVFLDQTWIGSGTGQAGWFRYLSLSVQLFKTTKEMVTKKDPPASY